MRREQGFTLIELLVVVAIIGIIAAIAVPSLLRARVSATEAQAIADIRAVMTAEEAYAAANCGLYSDVVNLCRVGGDCVGVGIPRYPANAPEFLNGDLGRVSPYLKSGYERRWEEDISTDFDPSRCDGDSVVAYCYHATPFLHGISGVRGFMGYSITSAIYVDTTGAAVPCPPDSEAAFLE